LVVPNFHGEWPLDDHPAFAERLRAWQDVGHEIYLHGFYHQATTNGRRGLSWFYAQRIMSGGDHLHVYDPVRSARRPSVVLNFASRTPGRLFSSVAWCRIAKHARVALPTRVAIHPADMNFALLRRETKALLAWAKGHLAERGHDLLA
jgi:predicted deacetylase